MTSYRLVLVPEFMSNQVDQLAADLFLKPDMVTIQDMPPKMAYMLGQVVITEEFLLIEDIASDDPSTMRVLRLMFGLPNDIDLEDALERISGAVSDPAYIQTFGNELLLQEVRGRIERKKMALLMNAPPQLGAGEYDETVLPPKHQDRWLKVRAIVDLIQTKRSLGSRS